MAFCDIYSYFFNVHAFDLHKVQYYLAKVNQFHNIDFEFKVWALEFTSLLLVDLGFNDTHTMLLTTPTMRLLVLKLFHSMF